MAGNPFMSLFLVVFLFFSILSVRVELSFWTAYLLTQTMTLLKFCD